MVKHLELQNEIIIVARSFSLSFKVGGENKEVIYTDCWHRWKTCGIIEAAQILRYVYPGRKTITLEF